MNGYECPEKIYKFLPFDGLQKTLQNRTFKLSRPRDFNDPLDMYLQESFSKDLQEFSEEIKAAFQDFVEGNIDCSALPDGPFKTKITMINAGIQNATSEQRSLLRQVMVDTPISQLFNLDRIQLLNQETIQHIQNCFETDGIFCTTTDPQNLLMWAHYADQHRGAVLEFTPSIENDSVLLASRKVQYSDMRPLLYGSAQDMIQHGLTMTQDESVKIILDRLVFTKSREWQYEQEYRLYVPFLMKLMDPFATLNYHSEELTGIFLGCRMNEDNRNMACSLAKAINPDVRIFNSSILPREYKLSFQAL